MKNRLAVYHYRYLPYSETFIHRQLMGLGRYFDIKLITHGVENIEEFPGFDPLVVPSRTAWRNLIKYDDKYFAKHLFGSDLFHVNFGHVAVNMQDHAFKIGIPMTAYFLGVDASACLNNPDYRKKLRDSRFAAVFVNSENMKKRLSTLLPDVTKCHVAYLGIPLERFPFNARRTVPDDAIFLQVSRLEQKKGVDLTMKAFSRYSSEFPNARLIVAGDGPLKFDLQRLSRSLGIENKVHFAGYIGYRKYAELLQTAHAFIHPSITADDGDMEGLPTVVCEAMASGLPVISSRHSGIPEIIDDGSEGFLAEEGDVDGIYSKMLLLKKVDVEAVSRRARLKIESKFDHDKTAASLIKYMKSIITGGAE